MNTSKQNCGGNRRSIWPLVLLATSLAFPPAAFSDPPPWAPAWGYRGKHKHKSKHHRHEVEEVHVHHYYDEAPEYYDQVNGAILSGTCNRALIGGMIGGATGGLVGAQIGKGDGKLAATAAGAVLGYVLGQHVGRSMDQADIRCTGHVLEAAPDRQTVVWKNPDAGEEYAVTPVKTYESAGRYCREYTLRASTVGGRPEEVYGTACRNSDGSWQVVD